MNEKYMKVAIKQANIALKNGDVPVGAVIVKDNVIIAKAYNKREKLNDATAHAEIIAIKKACKKIKQWRLNNCSIYVTLEPCKMCMGAINQARIENLFYGACNTGDINNDLLMVNGGIMNDSCSELLKTFFKSKRK